MLDPTQLPAQYLLPTEMRVNKERDHEFSQKLCNFKSSCPNVPPDIEHGQSVI